MTLYRTLQEAAPFFVIAGPCVVEKRETMLRTAEFLKELCHGLDIPFVFKSSYKKANRSSSSSYSGPGMDEGLKILEEIKDTFELPIISDVHETIEVSDAAEVCDILQIPAFLARQTELIRTAARSGKIINMKKGQFMAPEDMRAASEKAHECGNDKILLTERGSCFGYHNLVVDFRGFAIMEEIGYPVVYDLTHSLQRPTSGVATGGNPEFAPMMAKAAMATGVVKGLFLECHPEPKKGLSDASTMLDFNQVESILKSCVRIVNAAKE